MIATILKMFAVLVILAAVSFTSEAEELNYNEATIQYVVCKRIKTGDILCVNTSTEKIWIIETPKRQTV